MVWQPKPRPQWVEELNAFGRQLGAPAALVSLDEGSLLGAARDATGLDDFGDDGADGGWREGLAVFLLALEHEADLHLLGRIMARNDIVRALVNRLEVRDTLARHPEIRDERVDSPLLVVGTGRSGTSLLHELLAQDPRHRVARTWELLHPCPPPERRDLRNRSAHRGRRPGVHVLAPDRARVPHDARERRRRSQRRPAHRHAPVRVGPSDGVVPHTQLRPVARARRPRAGVPCAPGVPPAPAVALCGRPVGAEITVLPRQVARLLP